MQSIFIQYICLISIVLGLITLANKLRLAYPIVLVLGGLALSFVAPFSNITINPELVFLIFLPPLLYEAAWQVSWKEFWKWRGLIIGFAFPIVILTSCAIAVVSSAIIPGFTLALGFLLGGIISPPDAVSATTIMRQVNVPKSMVSLVEGESLLNDASALIVFRFALAAVLTGQFQLQEATVPITGSSRQLRFCDFNRHRDRTCCRINLLRHSSFITHKLQHRNRFNTGHALLYVLFCRTLSCFGRVSGR